MSHTEPARRPPPDLAGLDPSWSRLVGAVDDDGIRRSWHVLDNWSSGDEPEVTLLCVHGNPSWSYLFRELLAAAPPHVRVIAVDHLDMGYSERTGTVRRLADRIDDLDVVTSVLAITGPVVTVAHDWGGPISLGWALRHPELLRGVVLMNTAVHQPAGSPAPGLIRLVRSRPMLRPVTTATTAFIRGAFELSAERPASVVRSGFLAPYDSAGRRAAIGEFVADIPLEPDHPSAATLDAIADGLGELADVPALLLWGAADRVFSDLYLHDLERRLPHAEVHRYSRAGHFVSEDTDCLSAALDWVTALDLEPTRCRGSDASVSRLIRPAGEPSDRLAIAEMTGDRASIDARGFEALVEATARGLAGDGIGPGDRVALLIPPGIELGACLLGTWRAGATVVLVDSGLGPRNMSAALRSANPDVLIGIPRAMVAGRALRWPGRRISTVPMSTPQQRAFGVTSNLDEMRASPGEAPTSVAGSDVAAIGFTSGATGPSKGVLYSHDQLDAQRRAIAELYDIGPDDRLVAAFAPFALYGPLLGIPSVVPDMDVAAPATLTASALADAVERIDATLVFASPAALANVVATAEQLSATQRVACDRVRLLLSAGAPVRPTLLAAAAALFPNADAATPYGMTECLPVANITLSEIVDAGDGDGVCVGEPVSEVDVRIRPLDGGGLTSSPGVVGEIVVRAPHARLGYDRLWHTEHQASQPRGWHATGDVGQLDRAGRLWVGGRLGHVISTNAGAVTPVRLEQQAESVDGVDLAAAVGVGPDGAQQVAIVVQPSDPPRSARPAGLALHDRIRGAVDAPIVAVLEVPEIPVDRRHNSKVDRARLAEWAGRVLAGARMTDP